MLCPPRCAPVAALRALAAPSLWIAVVLAAACASPARVLAQVAGPPTLTGVTADAPAFSPNGDGARDSVRVRFTLENDADRLRVLVRRVVAGFPDSVIVALFDGPDSAGTDTLTWDGRGISGEIAPEGEYRFFLEAMNDSGADTDSTGVVVLDLTPPEIPTFAPLPPPRVELASLRLDGLAPGADTVIVFRDGAVVQRPIPDAEGEFTTTVILNRGANTLALAASDRAGNRSATGPEVVVVFERPLGFLAPARFRPGDRFEINLTTAARAVRIELLTLDGRRVRSLTAGNTDTSYLLAWDARDDEGRELGDGPYLVRLRVTRVDGTVDEETHALVMVK